MTINKEYFNNINLPLLYKKYHGPVWVYEYEKIISQINKLRDFDIIRYAQKACSNIHILRLMKSNKVKVDAVSIGEIERALLAGFNPYINNNDIIFTADLLDEYTLKRIIELNIPINVGSINMLSQIGKHKSNYNIWLRINPGFGYGHSKKTNTGGENSKHGIWHEELSEAISCIKYFNLNLVGIHMHIGSGVNYNHLSKVCNEMIKHVVFCKKNILYISAGGGLSTPYTKEDTKINVNNYFNLWNNARNIISDYLGYKVNLEIEPGRFLVAESGVLVSQVKAIKSNKNRHFILVDVGFNDLIRPVMYGSYHHISLLPHDGRNLKNYELINTVIGGPLCESGDIFTQSSYGDIITRLLPPASIGDYIIFHDTGAYGSSMSSNYNSRPLLPEVLCINGKDYQIRQRQTLKQLFDLELKCLSI
ncbi:MAG: diaminopimelate decarboxylase [Enterobacterales bacterium]